MNLTEKNSKIMKAIHQRTPLINTQKLSEITPMVFRWFIRLTQIFAYFEDSQKSKQLPVAFMHQSFGRKSLLHIRILSAEIDYRQEVASKNLITIWEATFHDECTNQLSTRGFALGPAAPRRWVFGYAEAQKTTRISLMGIKKASKCMNLKRSDVLPIETENPVVG